MNPLLKRLARLRLKVRLIDGWQGICAVVALFVGFVFVAGVTDYFLQLPSVGRGVLLISLLVGCGSVAYALLIKPFSKPCDDLHLALRVEEQFPELNDSLASTVQFLKQSEEEQARVGGSPAMRDVTVQTALAKADQVDFGRVIDLRLAVLFSAAAVLTIACAGASAYFAPAYSYTAMLRLAEPFGGHTWTTISVQASRGRDINWNELDPRSKEPDRIAHNQPYRIKVEIGGKLPRQAKVEVQSLVRVDATGNTKQEWQSDTEQIFAGDKLIAKDGMLTFELPIHKTQTHFARFRYRITANDGAFPPRTGAWHEVEVMPKPRLENLDGQPSPQIDLIPPAYTDLPATKLVGAKNLRMFEGTRVVLRAKADRPLAEAVLELHPQKKKDKKEEEGVEAKEAPPVPPEKITAEFEADRSIFSFKFTPKTNIDYANLHMRDQHGLDADVRIEIAVEKDPLPELKIVQPSYSLVRKEDGEIRFSFRVTDEVFAVKQVYIEHRKCKADGTPDDTTMKRVPIYSDAHRPAMPFLHILPKLTPKELKVEMLWRLENQFKSGDHVVIVLCAEDFYDLDAARGAGRSLPIELRVLSRNEVIGGVAKEAKSLKERFQEIAKREEAVMKLVKETRTKDKLTPAEMQALIEAELEQRKIQDEVGRGPTQGMRGELWQLQKQLKDNDEAGSKAAQEINKMKGALEHIAQAELPQIEQKFADARKEISDKDKNSPKSKANLDSTARLQKDVIDAINELNKDLARDNDVNKHREKIRNLQAQQDKLANDLKGINDFKKEAETDKEIDPKQIQKIIENRLAERAKEQKAIAEDLRSTLQEIEKSKQELQNQGDKDNAKKLDNALKQANPDKNEPLTGKMENIARDLQNKKDVPEQAIQDARQTAKELEKVLEKLEGREQDTTKLDIKDRQDVRKEIDQVAKDAQKLQKQAEALQKEMDKEERLKKREELIKQHEQMREQIAKLERQAARLQEQAAANQLRQAADEIEKAKQKLEQDMNPQQEEQNAQNNLKRAQNELERAEEALAREALIKIADKLQGLKLRQEALVGRSEKFHERLMDKKRWMPDNLNSMENNIDVQKMVAEETDALREKIAQAKVFNDIMEKAKKSMDTAVENMIERRADGLNHQEMKMDAEKLKGEVEFHDRTVEYQKHAAQRLNVLLDALKEQINKKPKQRKDPAEVAKENPEDPKEKIKKQPPQAPRDGIPPMAELKALKAEQVDLKQRTEEFHTKNPKADELDEKQLQRLTDLRQEQERLQSLFLELTARPMNIDEPMPKEGEKK